uniref:Uncharacterized protein n=1 Tax=mine drainage metagenome TaxID=410659 RepID=E6QHY5_9ZZZZ
MRNSDVHLCLRLAIGILFLCSLSLWYHNVMIEAVDTGVTSSFSAGQQIEPDLGNL